MLWREARTICWKTWAAKHEFEELKKSIWLEPTLAMLRRRTKEAWTDKHRHVARKLVLEGGGWVQRRLFDIGWSDEKKCQGCNTEEGTEKHRLYHCPCWKEDYAVISNTSGAFSLKGVVAEPLQIITFETPCPFDRARLPWACDMEEVGSESSRKMKDMEETTSEASGTAVTKGKE